MLTERELAERARTIRRLDHECKRIAARECELIVEMGKILLDTKKRMKGGWKEWASGKKHLPFEYRTATRYMAVAEKETLMSPFFFLGRTLVYQLMELDDKTLARLTPDSKIGGKRLRDIEDCHELDAAIAEMKGEKREPSDLAKAMGAIQLLRRVKETDPGLWSEIDDDVAALLGGDAKPERGSATLDGATREARGRALLALLRQILALIDDVDDVAGVLPGEIKQQAMVVAQAIWREVNRLPAYATLPPKEPAPDAPRRPGRVSPG